MSATLLLARHGSHDELGRVLSGRSEIALNAAGRAEAAALADLLATGGITAIVSSPRRRARDTAAPAAARLGLPVLVAAAMDEVDFGGWAGRRFADLDGDPAWARWNAARGTAPTPGGETMAAAVDRAWRHLCGLTGTVLVVSHCDIIRGVAAAAIGLPLDRLLALPCDPGSLTRLAADPAGLRLQSLNERPPQQSSFAMSPQAAYPARGSQPGAAA